MYSKIIDRLGDYFPPEDQIVTHGTRLQLKPAGTGETLSGILVGMVHEKTLIVNLKGYTDLTGLKGKTAQISYLHEGSLIEFSTAVLQVLEQPVQLIFLGFPKKINKKTLRSLDRTPCYLPALLITSKEAFKCIINNISDSGCNVVLKTQNTKPPLLNLKEIIQLNFKLPGNPKEIDISGKIRNVKKADREINAGVQFSYISDDITRQLNAFIASLI